MKKWDGLNNMGDFLKKSYKDMALMNEKTNQELPMLSCLDAEHNQRILTAMVPFWLTAFSPILVYDSSPKTEQNGCALFPRPELMPELI